MHALIVDDSGFMREYLRHLLEKMGMTCEEAANGVEALETMRAGEDFDLVLLDVNMPVMNGLECVKKMREEELGEGTKVMMITTEIDHEFIRSALDRGADEFLMKPFTWESLHAKMRMLGFTAAA